MIERYFVYDKMMLKNTFEELLKKEAVILSTIPAFITGKLFIKGNVPICVDPSYRSTQPPRITYGVIHEVDITRFGIELLDRLQGCSLSTMGFNYRNDLVHRLRTTATAIRFDDIVEFSKYNYEIVGDSDVWVYLGNCKNPYIKEAAWNRDNKRGSVWRDFFSTTNY